MAEGKAARCVFCLRKNVSYLENGKACHAEEKTEELIREHTNK